MYTQSFSVPDNAGQKNVAAVPSTENPELMAELLQYIGKAQYNLSDHTAADQTLAQAVETYRQVLEESERDPAALEALFGQVRVGLPGDPRPAPVRADVDGPQEGQEAPDGPRTQQVAAGRGQAAPREFVQPDPEQEQPEAAQDDRRAADVRVGMLGHGGRPHFW